MQSPNGIEVVLDYVDYDLDGFLYINGILVMSELRGDATRNFKVKLQKGNNVITYIANVLGGRDPSFLFWLYGPQRAQISGVV